MSTTKYWSYTHLYTTVQDSAFVPFLILWPDLKNNENLKHKNDPNWLSAYKVFTDWSFHISTLFRFRIKHTCLVQNLDILLLQWNKMNSWNTGQAAYRIRLWKYLPLHSLQGCETSHLKFMPLTTMNVVFAGSWITVAWWEYIISREITRQWGGKKMLL